MAEATHIRANHWAAFRSGKWAKILTIAPDAGDRSCYVIEFPDGATDFWVVDDPAAEYEFRPEVAAKKEAASG